MSILLFEEFAWIMINSINNLKGNVDSDFLTGYRFRMSSDMRTMQHSRNTAQREIAVGIRHQQIYLRKIGHALRTRRNGMSSKKCFRAFSCLLLCFGQYGNISHGADLTAGYQSGTVIMADAGLCIDVIESPAQQGLIYCHDDVSGMYRRGPSDTVWVKLNVAGRVPTNLGIDGADGTPGIGCSYKDANKVYMAWAGHFFRSSNKGDTWLAENSISPAITSMLGNGTYRMAERMTVDPLNDEVVYYGSQKNGLYRSLDGGVNWSKITAVPEGDTADGGVVRIICDRKGAASDNPPRCAS
jgi:hypothetical protein